MSVSELFFIALCREARLFNQDELFAAVETRKTKTARENHQNENEVKRGRKRRIPVVNVSTILVPVSSYNERNNQFKDKLSISQFD